MSNVNQNLCDIDSLIPYARNSRTHSDSQVSEIASSIEEFGFAGSIVVRDGVIAKGHGTLAAAKKILSSGKAIYPPPGKKAGAHPFPNGLIPVIDASGWTESQFKAFVIADNKLAMKAGWDMDLLALEILDLREEKFDLSVLGFSDFELNELDKLAGTGASGGLTDPDDIPAAPEKPVSKPGDIWILGEHRLMCGDSTQAGEVARLCAGAKIDLLLTDPPYNVAYEGGTKDKLTIENDSMDDASFRAFLRDAFVAADAMMKPGAVFYIWHADSEGFNFRGACRDVGWKVAQCLIWKKSSLVMGRQDYQWIHEPCLYGWKTGASHLWAADRKQTTVLEFDKPSRNAEHPTMKPVALFEYQLLNNTKGGDIVLDVFSGSGTNLIACTNQNRIAFNMEFDPRYVDVQVKRWQDYTGKAATREHDGLTFAEAKELESIEV